jgi:pyridoxamine 5'-phosphate oxidase
MFQNPALNAVITVRGTINILDNASIRAEVLEAVGPRLRAFWKLYQEERELLVLETILEEAVFYRPMSGRKETLRIASP